MNKELKALLSEVRLAGAGAPLESIRSVATRLATVFPPDYVAFMREANGGEGPIGVDGYVQLWPIETLVEWNDAHSEFCPGFVFLGGNGAGEGIALRSSPDGPELFLLPFIGDTDDALFGGRSLVEFLSSYGSGRIWQRDRR